MIGGGAAGMEAAREAALLGADVTILEKSPRPELPWREWPALLNDTRPEGSRPPGRFPGERSVGLELGVEVESVSCGRATTADGRIVRADSFVAATGSLLAPQRFLGLRKDGVWVLDSPAKYSALGRGLDAVSGAVVAGDRGRALQVAEQLRHRGCEVTLCLSQWDSEVPAAPLLEVLTDAAAASGVKFEHGTPERAVGVGALEGVTLRGRVVPCDAFVVLPRRSPAPVRTRALTGPRGGLLVDRWLRTSIPGLYAAGGCAEAGGPLRAPRPLEDSPGASGRAAGANAAGRAVAVSPSGFRSLSVFGLRWWRTGVGPGWFLPAGARVFSRRWGADSGCSITYDGRSGTVLGLEAAGPAGPETSPDPVASLQGATLHTLAYCERPSTDISVVSDTARLALTRWQES